MTIQIRITCRNNSDARRFDLVRGARHNGGKLVIVSIDESELASVEETLDAAHEVASYEIVR